jgi:hypothetical protein
MIMSKIWFRAKIRYEKTAENGMNKRVSENYLVDALSFTEAEARIIGEVTPFISGEFTVTDLKRENISELFSSEADKDDRWYKIKVAFVTLDEKLGKGRKSYSYMLVQSSDTASAEKMLHERMKGTLSNYEVMEVKETNIIDVYPYKLDAETDETR